jgi:hypothetical protein
MENKKLQTFLKQFPDNADINISVSGQYLDIDNSEGEPLAAIDLDTDMSTTWQEVWIEEEVTQPEITSVEGGIITYVGTGEDNIILPDPAFATVGAAKKVKTGHYEIQPIITKIVA